MSGLPGKEGSGSVQFARSAVGASRSDANIRARTRRFTEQLDSDLLKARLITHDDFPWKISTSQDDDGCCCSLKYIGGVDLSFSKEDPSVACGSLVVLEVNTLNVVYSDFSLVNLHVPYIPGFLAFREAPVLLELLRKMKGNGFGLACHLGVLADLPTIGVGKNLHHVDGISQSKVRQLFEAEENYNKDMITLVGDSGQELGVPIFVSVGHRVSLATVVAIVKMTSKYRVPEPVRQTCNGQAWPDQGQGPSFGLAK
ncbi:Endonuclease V, partial [Dillenia turbinata]